MGRLQILFKKFLDNSISPDQYTELWQLLEAEEHLNNLSPELQALWEKRAEYTLPDNYWNRKLKELKAAQQPTVKRRFIFWRYAAAAVLVVMLGGTYFFINRKEPGSITKTHTNVILPNDVKPGTNGAILSFSNGKTIVLDTADNGQLTDAVTKTEGSITVQGATVEYATLTTPKARQQQLVLADGSKVWLNAASSIKFPTAFIGDKREVEITGEVYLEIAPLQREGSLEKIPFIVKVNGAEINVLGTHFNIMAYSNESSLQTTLLEGSVKFSNGNHSVLLKPGQQSQLLSNGQIKLVANADVQQAVAWKNGITSFHSADVATIMRAIERWYDVDVEIKGEIPKRSFYVEVSRTATLAQLLKVFEVNKINFKIDGINKKLTVMP